MSKHASYFLGIPLLFISFLTLIEKANASYNLPDPYAWTPATTPTDTIPLQDRKGNWVEDPNHNPFDLLDPEEVTKDVQYDPATDSYILTEMIGNENYRPPTQMTYQEYVDWKSHEDEKDYFKKLSGEEIEDAFDASLTFQLSKEVFNEAVDPVSLLGEKTPIYSSKGEARKAIQGNGVSINKEKINLERKISSSDLLYGKYLLAQKGKKNYYLISVN